MRGAGRRPGSRLIRGDPPERRESASPHERVNGDRSEVRPSWGVRPGAVGITGRTQIPATDRSRLRPIEASFDRSKPSSTDRSQVQPIEANFCPDQTTHCPEMGPNGAVIADRSQFRRIEANSVLGRIPLLTDGSKPFSARERTHSSAVDSTLAAGKIRRGSRLLREA
jgi:hypothetical protein